MGMNGKLGKKKALIKVKVDCALQLEHGRRGYRWPLLRKPAGITILRYEVCAAAEGEVDARTWCSEDAKVKMYMAQCTEVCGCAAPRVLPPVPGDCC